jgi:recombination protein RecA
MKEQHRQRAIRLKLARMEPRSSPPPLLTGFPELDSVLGGGWPRGRMVELFGPASSGKSTLALQSIASLQQNAGAAAWIDADHTFDPAYASALGVNIERLPVMQPNSAEEAHDMMGRLAASMALDLLVVDSAAALVPRLELETGIGESGSGLHSRVLASGLRRLAAAVAKTDTCILFLNQTRSRWESSAGEIETSAGGAPLKLYAAARLALVPGASRRVCVRVLKNKAAEAFRETDLHWKDGLGFVKSP